jgi:hypothetical protein
MRPLLCRAFAVCALFFTPCCAREVLHLTNGFSLEAKSHVIDGERLVLTTSSGTLEFSVSDVTEIEVIAESIANGSPSDPVILPTPDELIRTAADAHGLPPEFVRSVSKVESALRQNAISRKGAVGLMQLMPQTAAELGVSAFDASQNAEGGARYLRELLLRYHGDAALALAAYNAGAGSIAKYRGIPPYPETRNYIVRVLREYERERKGHESAPPKQ